MKNSAAPIERDDLFHHRMGLACTALAEVPLRVRERISHWVNRLTNETYELFQPYSQMSRPKRSWSWEREMPLWLPGVLAQFKPVIEAAGVLNGYVKNARLIEFILDGLEISTTFIESARWIQIVGPPASMEEILGVLLLPFNIGTLGAEMSVSDWVLLAIRTLGQVLSENAIDQLLIAFVSLDPEVRTEALHGCPDSVRQAATEALGSLGEGAATKEVIDTLIWVIVNAQSEELAESAASALGKVGGAAATDDVLSALVQALENGANPEAAARALGTLAETRATEIVETVLKKTIVNDKEDQWLRVEAAYALNKLNKPVTKETMTNSVLRSFLCVDSNLVSDDYAMKAFFDLVEDSAAEELVRYLSQAVLDDDLVVRKNAVLALGCLGDRIATQQIIRILLALVQTSLDNQNDTEQDIVGRAALLSLSKLAQGTERLEAARLIARSIRDGWLPAFGIAPVVGRLATREVVDALLTVIQKSMPKRGIRHKLGESDRYLAIETLRWSGAVAATVPAATALCRCLRSDDSMTRVTATQVLGRLGKLDATVAIAVVDDLIRLLVTDHLWAVREAAAIALASFGASTVAGRVATSLIGALGSNSNAAAYSTYKIHTHFPGRRIFGPKISGRASTDRQYEVIDVVTLATLPAPDPATKIIGSPT